jgi:hypothetical protein
MARERGQVPHFLTTIVLDVWGRAEARHPNGITECS